MRFQFPGIVSDVRIHVISVVLCIAMLSGCASSEDIGKIQWDMNHMRSDIKELKQATPATYQKNEVDNKLNAIEERQKATASTVSDLLIQVQSMTSEFQMVNGRFEEIRFLSENSLSELSDSKEILNAKVKELESAVQDLNKQIADVKKVLSLALEEQKLAEEQRKAEAGEKEKKSSEAKKKSQKQQKQPVAAKTSTRTKIKDVYMTGYQALREGKTKQAREKFTSILNDYPENEYSDNARFWIGETFYKEENYPDAILAYEELFKNNPGSDKVPGAMLKQGLAFYSIKDEKTGKIILEKLIDKYPESEPARLARKKINRPSVPQKKK